VRIASFLRYNSILFRNTYGESMRGRCPTIEPRSLPGAASNFQHCGIVTESAQREQVIEDLIGIVGTSLVVELGVVIESPFQFVAISFNHRTQTILTGVSSFHPLAMRASSEVPMSRALFASVKITNNAVYADAHF
jgi:hypothetical protein